MYLKHYNLILKPFEISPDPKFLWLGEKHNEALAAMKYGILENKGFISLTGDVGTGKTTLVNALANSFGDNIIFAQVPDPSLEQLDFLNLTADAFKMNKKFSTKGDFLSHLKRFLNNAYVHHKEVVLVIEEAQRFDQERLEEVRLISNIEKPDKKLINIVFVGQNEFDSIITKNKALRQRVTIIHKIEPLQEIETKQYVMHRLKIAGSEKKIFSPEAVREIYSFSEGNPRLINIICDFALLTGYAKEKKIIEPEIIRECAANYLLPKQQKEDAIGDLRASAKTIPETGTGIPPGTSGNSYQKVAQKVRIKPAGLKFAYVTPIFVVILLSIFGYLYFFGENHAPYRNLKTFLRQAFDRYSGSKSETSSQIPDEITKRQGDMAGTQVQALNPKTQKTSIENELGQSRSSYDELTAEVKELKNTNARVAELEGVAAMREQMLIEMTEELDREKKNRELLSSELSSKVDLIAEVQQKLEDSQTNTLAFETEIGKSTIKINELQEHLSNLKSEKAAAETQLGEMRSRYDKLSADLDALKGVKERIAALEGELATRDQTLSQSEQQLSHLAKELSREKKSRELLSSELSSKVVLIARLQEKLENAQSNALEFEAEIENRVIKIRELQKQLLNLKLEKASTESQLGQLRFRNEELTANLEELKGASERVATLEGEAVSRKQTLSQSEQKIADLTSALDQEKQNRELLNSELSSKVDLIAELQEKLENSQSNALAFETEIENSTRKINELQEQLSNLKSEKFSAETQLGQLRSRYNELSADLNELKSEGERAAALEGAVATEGQRLADLAKALDREKQEREQLSSELSIKADLVAELQQKLVAILSSRTVLENDIGKSRKEIAALQGQLLDLKAQKTSSDTQLAQLRSRNEKLAADLAELQGAKDRVAALKGEAARREQAFFQSEQKLTALAEELDREKKSQDQLRAELSTKADRVAELQQELETTLSSRAELENDIEKSKKEIAELQNLLRDLKAQEAQTESSPAPVDVTKKSTSKSDPAEEQDESPSPADIIDWVLKKKAN